MENSRMQLTHEEAIQLIQFNADKAVHGIKAKMLYEHLNDCAHCSSYASQFKEMENVLQSVMHKQWNQRPAPLSIVALKATKKMWKNNSALLITRTALIGMSIFAFVMLGWQIAFTNNRGSVTYPGMLPVPTPSTQYTATTNTTALHCEEIIYKVQENDTLEGIAFHHATTKEIIMELNNMSTESIKAFTELLVPICNSTPTSTTYPPTFTNTPIHEPITYTPG